MSHPWNGHPLMNANRDGWHLLRFEDQRYPEPMWWDAKARDWRSDIGARLRIESAAMCSMDYTYVAGMVAPEEATASQKDAERLNWIGEQDVVIGEYTAPGHWNEVLLARYQRTLPADLDDIRVTLDRAMEMEKKA